MPRKPKLVAVTTLIPTGLREELKRQARGERRTVSTYLAYLLKTHPQVIRKELEGYGEEKEIG